MGLLDELIYALRRSSNGQIQEKPGLRDKQIEAQLQGLLAQSSPQMQQQMPQQVPQGLLAIPPSPPSQGIAVDQTTFSGKKKFKAK
jgi:hypothetical protein